jgi:protein tyrosine phosphatase (PTP) superfamily phosphohydrolase (DUF442 family)
VSRESVNPQHPTIPARSSRKPALLLAVILLLLASALVWQRTFSGYHFAAVEEGVLYRDGAAHLNQLEHAVEKSHAKTVVCLVDDSEISDPAKPQFRQEMDYLRKQNIHVERIPVTLGGWPTSSDIQRFLDITSDKSNQPVLVHCAQGVRRTAMMVAAYQESILGYDRERAKSAILTFGHSDKTINDIRRFIDGYDPKSRTVPAQLVAADRSEK